MRGPLSPKAAIQGGREGVKDEFSVGLAESEPPEAHERVQAEDLGCSVQRGKLGLPPRSRTEAKDPFYVC